MMRLLLVTVLFLFSTAASAKVIQESYVVFDPSALATLKVRPELTIDHVKSDHFEVYGPRGLGSYLTRLKIRFRPMPRPTRFAGAGYPKFVEIDRNLKAMAEQFPQTARLFSIGKSVQGKDLWVMKISRNVNIDDNRPEFKYIANMHGDEIVGREVMMRFIRDLLNNDGRDPRITRLLDDVQIYILPSMNPDGADAGSRSNANYTDLNRDFPDFSERDNQNTPEGRQPETQAVMKWQATRKFTLSANFHGGAEVVNYPWDTIGDRFPQYDLVRSLSLDYARLAPYIANSTYFENGITNGYEWYEVNGGMQDWSYHWYNDTQLTVELSDEKWPPYNQVDRFYEMNKLSLVDLIEKVRVVRFSKRR